MEASMNRYVWLVGRILLASIFLVGAAYKVVHWGDTTSLMSDYGFPAADFFLVLAVVIEFVGGVALVAGYRARQVAWILAGYLALITIAVHHDWSVPVNAIFSLANLSLIGGLLLIAAIPEPVPSVDALLTKRREEPTVDEVLAQAARAVQH
jgi:putative oxidoreductase